MPQIQNIAITDGTTPVTLTPDNNDVNGYNCSTEHGDIAAANLTALFSGKSVRDGKSQYARLRVPIVRADSVSGVDSVVGYNTYVLTAVTSTLATPAESLSGMSYFLDLCTDPSVNEFFVKQKKFF